MSQADSGYTTSRSIFAGGPALQRRQFVTEGGPPSWPAPSRFHVLKGFLLQPQPTLSSTPLTGTAERSRSWGVCSQSRMLLSESCGMRPKAVGPSYRPGWLNFVTLKAHSVVPR